MAHKSGQMSDLYNSSNVVMQQELAVAIVTNLRCL